MNKKLTELLFWANENKLSMDSWNINVKAGIVTLWQFEQTRENFRELKKVLGDFKEKGEAPSVVLQARVQILENEWKFLWHAAFSCEVEKKYTCTPAKFLDSEEESGSHP